MKLEKIPEPDQMNGERYFQCREVSGDSICYESFCVSGDTSEKEIKEIAADVWLSRMVLRDQMYIPSPFRRPPKWKNTILVTEQNRKIIPPTELSLKRGRNFTNSWTTKRKGLRFKLERRYCTMRLADGRSKTLNGYKAKEP